MENSYFELLPIELINIILLYVDDLLSVIPLDYRIPNRVLSDKEFFIEKFNINCIKLERDSFIYSSLTLDPIKNIDIYYCAKELYILSSLKK